MKTTIIAAAIGATSIAFAAGAEPATGGSENMAAAAYAITAPTDRVTLPGNSAITLQVTDQLSSSALRVGSKINLAVVNDVKVGDAVVIPAGAHAEAEISWRTGRGAFGKSGKIEFNLTRLDLGSRAVPLAGHYRVEGHGAPWAAVATVVAVGWPGIFITGHSAKVEPGTRFTAYTRESVAVDLPLRPPARQAIVRARANPVLTAASIAVQANEGPRAGQDDAIIVPM